MHVGVVTLFPQMFEIVSQHGVTGRAIERDIVTLALWNPRDYAHDRHRTVDDRPYGGGPGMVMQVQPLCDAITAARTAAGAKTKVVYLSPQGRRLDQDGLHELAARESLVLVAGRYEGIDERVVATHIDEEWSIGDYVLSGGELAAMVVIDGLARTLPGALGHEGSAQEDSFVDGLLDYPHYTRPEEINGMRVPDVLMSGDHQAIARWRHKQALGRTWQRRPDLIDKIKLDKEQQLLLNEYIQEHEQH